LTGSGRVAEREAVTLCTHAAHCNVERGRKQAVQPQLALAHLSTQLGGRVVDERHVDRLLELVNEAFPDQHIRDVGLIYLA
jgi:hypothetical protein